MSEIGTSRPSWLRKAEEEFNCKIDIVDETPDKKAEKLFIKHLSSAQYITFVSENYIDVRSNKGHKYRIHTNDMFINVVRLDGWFISKRKFCIILENILCPKYDHLLAQKLIIESD